MALTRKLRNVVARGVFGEAATVSQDDMRIASLTALDQAHNENAVVAQGLKRHDPELLDQLIVQYQHRLLRYLLYLTGNRETAEDIFQETWMRVLERADRYNSNLRFEPWLFSIARNLAIDHLRRQQRASLNESDVQISGAAAEIPASDFHSPFLAAARNEDAMQIAVALGALEPIYREALLLRFQEELSLEEIAQVAGAPVSTISSRIHRGLAMLRSALKGDADAI